MVAALALFGTLAVPSGALAGRAPRAPGFLSNNGKIAFWSTRDGNAQVYAMAPDGSGRSNLDGAGGNHLVIGGPGTDICSLDDGGGLVMRCP